MEVLKFNILKEMSKLKLINSGKEELRLNQLSVREGSKWVCCTCQCTCLSQAGYATGVHLDYGEASRRKWK